MSKPEWKDLPEEANYLAQDKSGTWWWYEDKPTFNPDIEIWDTNSGNGEALKVTNWGDSLQTRPVTNDHKFDDAIFSYFLRIAPAWVTYIARDPDGELWGYSAEPVYLPDMQHYGFSQDLTLEERRATLLLSNFPAYTSEVYDTAYRLRPPSDG